MQLDDPADAVRIRAAPNFTTVKARDDDEKVIVYTGLVTIEDKAAGIIAGTFNLKRGAE